MHEYNHMGMVNKYLYVVTSIVFGVTFTSEPVHAQSGPGLKIQGLFGTEITKEDLFRGALTGAWIVARPAAEAEVSRALSQPGDYSGYNINVALGGVVSVTVADIRSDGLVLDITLEQSRVEADFTQPFAGQYADPSVEIKWNSHFVIDVSYTLNGVCPGVPIPLPDLTVNRVTFDMTSPDVNVDSTLADIVAGVGTMFVSGGNVPLAIGAALGVNAAVDGLASGALPNGAFDLTNEANKKIKEVLSPCEIVQTFTGLLPQPFHTLSTQQGLIVVGVGQTGKSMRSLGSIIQYVVN